MKNLIDLFFRGKFLKLLLLAFLISRILPGFAANLDNRFVSLVQSAEREYSIAKKPGAFSTGIANYERGTAYYLEALKAVSTPEEMNFVVLSMYFMMMPKTPMVAPPLNEAFEMIVKNKEKYIPDLKSATFYLRTSYTLTSVVSGNYSDGLLNYSRDRFTGNFSDSLAVAQSFTGTKMESLAESFYKKAFGQYTTLEELDRLLEGIKKNGYLKNLSLAREIERKRNDILDAPKRKQEEIDALKWRLTTLKKEMETAQNLIDKKPWWGFLYKIVYGNPEKKLEKLNAEYSAVSKRLTELEVAQRIPSIEAPTSSGASSTIATTTSGNVIEADKGNDF